MPDYEGRFELTWATKHLRLLADGEGSCGRLDPSDCRVADVRLLHDMTTVGEVSRNWAANNRLIHGDALCGVTSLTKLPEFAKESTSARLSLFALTHGSTQAKPSSTTTQSTIPSGSQDRLVQIRSLLSPHGSVWVHLDDCEVAACRIVMDEVFGREASCRQLLEKLLPTTVGQCHAIDVCPDSSPCIPALQKDRGNANNNLGSDVA